MEYLLYFLRKSSTNNLKFVAKAYYCPLHTSTMDRRRFANRPSDSLLSNHDRRTLRDSLVSLSSTPRWIKVYKRLKLREFHVPNPPKRKRYMVHMPRKKVAIFKNWQFVNFIKLFFFLQKKSRTVRSFFSPENICILYSTNASWNCSLKYVQT